MKELSVEEKAKAYDEAKLRISAAYNSNRCTIGFMNEIFPELKESEDEMIRKALIKLVKKAGEGYENVIDGVSIENAISWLEKQWEQKPAEWSDTDYVMQRAALEILIASPKTVAFTILKESVIVWFKSLKNRLQPKLKWSDEDEEMIDSIIGNIKYLYSIGSCDNATVDKKVNWLKSLRPQSQWRPSEEQIYTLEKATHIVGSKYKSCLNSLYSDLIKLREK